jgi:hypothetical protein
MGIWVQREQMSMKSLSLVILASMAMPAFASGPPKVSMREAMEYENQIVAAAASQPVVLQAEMLYTQPVNQTEPCKLPTSQDQLHRKNFRAYWDGVCKDGFAFGLGRDIAISDTHHLEEITVHNHSSPEIERPSVSYDFVNNRSAYSGVVDATKTSHGSWQQIVRNPDDSISVTTNTGEASQAGQLAMSSSPFEPQKITSNARNGQPVYVFSDYSAAPTSSDQPASALAVFDPKSKQPVGYRIVGYRNGVVQHQGPAGLVRLPQEYVDHLVEKIVEVNTAVSKASAASARAQQMEREYLFAACKSDYSIEGVPPKDIPSTREICTWREQWKEPYAKAQASYEQKMADARQQVSAREQQLDLQRTQQQLAMQQQQAANAAAWAAMSQSWQHTNNSIQQQTQQLMNFQAPQVQPIGQPSNQIVCKTFGRITKCQ